MAEIHVEKKRGAGAWLWVVLLVVLVIAAAIYLWQAGYIQLSHGMGTGMESPWFEGGRNGA